MSRDGMFGLMLRFTKVTDKKGNPYVAVIGKVRTTFMFEKLLFISHMDFGTTNTFNRPSEQNCAYCNNILSDGLLGM